MEATPQPYFPFSAFLGFGAARKALLCTLLDPTLCGVIISGSLGTGKSALLKSFDSFVHRHIDPELPFIHLPLGVTDDRLIGGVDLDATIATGAVQARMGLLAEANNGYLLVDDLPLLDALTSATILGGLERGEYYCEREGISRRYRSRFVLLAATTSVERGVSELAAERAPFLIGEERRISTDSAQLLLRMMERYYRSPDDFYTEYDQHERRLAEAVTLGRMLHGMLAPVDEVLLQLTLASLKLCVGGNRADIFAAKAARAHAALRGARAIEDVDIDFAIQTVLTPRNQNIPDEHTTAEGNNRTETPQSPADNEPDYAPSAHGDYGNSNTGTPMPEMSSGAPEEEEEREASADGEDERIFSPADFATTFELADFFARNKESAGAGSHGISSQWQRGRHSRSVEAPHSGKRIALGATLRTAAPHQRTRGRRQGGQVIVRKGDIRVKRFNQRAGTLFIFCVDASGSMAANRMREAKGAVAYLLHEAYINRDTVALIAFRGYEAEVLLPPTNSVERAKRSLDILPTGGGTPLASALLKAFAMAMRARRSGLEQVLVVFMTDGRANVPMGTNAADMIMDVRRRMVREELEMLGNAYKGASIKSIIVDTKHTSGKNSDAGRLAEYIGGAYHLLPDVHAQELASIVRGAMGK